jgi:putative Mg2+ transporter-C (MgtC) family protein
VGVTTAAGIWGTAAVGMSCGAAVYVLAVFATALTLIVLAMLRQINKLLPHEGSLNDQSGVQ